MVMFMLRNNFSVPRVCWYFTPSHFCVALLILSKLPSNTYLFSQEY